MFSTQTLHFSSVELRQRFALQFFSSLSFLFSLFLSIPLSLTPSLPPSLCLSYAKIHIPIIASVSEHQPTTWTAFFFDLHILVCVFPAGVWFMMKYLTDERVFGEGGRPSWCVVSVCVCMCTCVHVCVRVCVHTCV